MELLITRVSNVKQILYEPGDSWTRKLGLALRIWSSLSNGMSPQTMS